MVLAPVLSGLCFHTIIGEQKPPRSKLCGGDSLGHRLIRKTEETTTHSLDLHAKSSPSHPGKPSPGSFGYVTGLGHNELGYLSLRELAEAPGLLGIGIEIDAHFHPMALGKVKEFR